MGIKDIIEGSHQDVIMLEPDKKLSLANAATRKRQNVEPSPLSQRHT